MNGIITFINGACDPEAGPHLTMLTPWSQTSSLQNWEQCISVHKPPVYGISLQQLDGLRPSLGASVFCIYKG